MSAPDDYAAMLELASEMSWVEAAKFIRAETGRGLREAADVVENRIVPLFPDSNCAVSFQQRCGK